MTRARSLPHLYHHEVHWTNDCGEAHRLLKPSVVISDRFCWHYRGLLHRDATQVGPYWVRVPAIIFDTGTSICYEHGQYKYAEYK